MQTHQVECEVTPLGMPRPDARRADKMLQIIRRGIRNMVVAETTEYDPQTKNVGPPKPNPDFTPRSKFDFTQWVMPLQELMLYCRGRNLASDALEKALEPCWNNTLATHDHVRKKLYCFLETLSAEVTIDFHESRQSKSAAPPAKRRRISGELNQKVLDELQKNPYASSRAIGDRIGCSHTAVENTIAFKWVNQERMKGRKPKARSIREHDQQIQTGEDAELNKLLEDQEEDAESDRYSRRSQV